MNSHNLLHDESPLARLLERSLRQAKREGVLLGVVIHLKHSPTVERVKTHDFQVDPWTTGAKYALVDIALRLSECPGESFEGEIRITFENRTTKERYASFTKTLNSPTNRSDP